MLAEGNIYEQNIYPDSYHDLSINEAIMEWDEAIPMGNGLFGCLVWGDGFPLRFSLDRGDLWDTRTLSSLDLKEFNYKNLIKFAKNKDKESIVQKFEKINRHPFPSKIAAGRLYLNYGRKCDAVQNRLVLREARLETRLFYGDSCSVINSFIHAGELYGYITVDGSVKLPEVEIIAHNYCNDANTDSEASGQSGASEPDSLTQLGYPYPVYGSEGDLTWFCQKTCEDLEFGIVACMKKVSGSLLEVAYTVASSTDGGEWLENAKRIVSDAISGGYEKALKGHRKWWESFWDKSAVKLPDKMYETQWYLTNYLFGSCSRKGFPPMPLQGVWTADTGKTPPWKGDYHNDLNTQMSYWHYLKANHLEEGSNFIDFLWNLVPEGRKYAREFYDADGICMPSIMSINGKNLGGWAMYSYSVTNQIWLCQAFDHYWRYTGDAEFLKQKAYPYLKETAQCLIRWLDKGEDGKLRLPVSSSPEIHDNNIEAWLTPNSNYDLSLMIYLFKTLFHMSRILENGELQEWKALLDALPALAVNEQHVLMLSPDESLNESHRHHAQMMAVYPLNLLDPYSEGQDNEIINASVADLERLGSGLWVGFSFPWMAEFYARQGNGEGAAYQLKIFWECCCSKNGFNLNGDYKKRGVSLFHYRPFTLEANMCAADALQEMLLQTYNGIIRTFPAIPEEWAKKEVSFTRFRGEGGILVSSEIKDGRLQYILLEAEREGEFRLQNKYDSDRLCIENEGSRETIFCKPNEIFSVRLNKKEKCRIVSERVR